MGEVVISDNKDMLDIGKIHEMLKNSYWAENRTKDTIKKSLEQSICYGAYSDKEMVGFLRIVTDYTTMYWVCDVIVDKNHRSKSIGKKLMAACLNDKRLKGCFGILATKDAHGLYEKYGFKTVNDKYMRKDAEDKG